jgi:ATP-dependent Clp protease ATP-binding subunit ClpB
MNDELVTEKAREAIASAQQLAETHQHAQVEPEHLLLALIDQPQGVVPRVLERMQITPQAVRQAFEQALAAFPVVRGATVRIGVSPRLRDVLTRAQDEMRELKDDYISTEHLLLAMTDAKVGGALEHIVR